MASETDFLNDALGMVGVSESITGIDQGTINANWCKRFWPPLRRGMLRMHRWKFAETRAVLVQNVTVPIFEFSYAYKLPRDLVAIRDYNGNAVNLQMTQFGWMAWTGYYKVEGDNIYTNDGEVRLVYTRDSTNPDEWDGLFYQAAVSWLASKLAMPIRKDPGLSRALFQDGYGALLPLALALDGQEGTQIAYQADDLIWGRE